MATVRELAARIGEDALVSFEKGNVSVRCRIVDARTAYGKAQLLVQPVAGEGETWVEEARIRPCGPAPVIHELLVPAENPGGPLPFEYRCQNCGFQPDAEKANQAGLGFCPGCGGTRWEARISVTAPSNVSEPRI